MSKPIYTKNGDTGDTSLYSGGRYSKSDEVFEVLGTLDELSASLGLVKAPKNKEINTIINDLQEDLFAIGAFIANLKSPDVELIDLTQKTEEMEKEMDEFSKLLPELTNFILPGGSTTSAQLHFSRAVCRRLERSLIAYLDRNELDNDNELNKYFNRLSDLLFVLARYSNNKSGVHDIIWEGKS
ncbi:MAG: Cob(I)alamin adenosyltransferase [candidate division WWE3 bacterium GW2011_GWC1_41_7]|uniref:Corrinoid adenosyltransferase n=3 Tax=Katanobacteria TaxID=422282 RepID=A0A0G0XAG1_UNCKA|nr:MAG: hypothetical protein UU72_C0008G0029 [candidate division WWE3 bacterium GW2011_GWB1_41_6]KKS20320.1 MAG: Cob(I)alamin adenosyltransferase [candidate division WWE3 bacterium GW2011_GWC1_41_7]KKS21969.1 MAG: hypothetical protein UU80_C0016G0001 [candidate division WWE3 bacterium GW2011_GWA1_41_8]